ncbi:MAG: KH domain-containing protein [Armatimonadetes bacterium]|nr:KH domain-containing protein [Armatimonadota bacterium]
MNTLEITADSIDEAVKEAAEKLGVKGSDLDVTVLEETKGLFGKGKVRVKVVLPEGAAEKQTEPEPEEKPKPKPKPKTAAKKPKKQEASTKPEEETAKEEAPEPAEEVLATEQDADELKAILTELLELADFEAEAQVTEIQGRYVNINLDGRDVSYLVGRRGEVLNALQYLMNVMSTRKLGRGVRVVLEGNEYRKKRQEVLTKLATQIATEVASRGEEAVLDALPAFERRVVHKALSEFEGVKTYSEGEEPERRVVIAPDK